MSKIRVVVFGVLAMFLGLNLVSSGPAMAVQNDGARLSGMVLLADEEPTEEEPVDEEPTEEKPAN
ncbi:MAG: hypothetical protein OEZ32_13345 [Nitrospinota bacterium]|nr:hypothetical protein [Nitrospinota bacterium]